MEFREEIKNFKGLRPMPITMAHGKTYDWNMLTRVEKQIMKKSIKRSHPKLWDKMQATRKLKIYTEPIAENVYFCDKCNKTHVAHELDVGAVPAFITCHNCNWPETRSLGYEIPASYKNSAPQIVFRLSTIEEYETAPLELQEHLEGGGLWMEIVK